MATTARSSIERTDERAVVAADRRSAAARYVFSRRSRQRIGDRSRARSGDGASCSAGRRCRRRRRRSTARPVRDRPRRRRSCRCCRRARAASGRGAARRSAPTARPIGTEPVAEMSGRRVATRRAPRPRRGRRRRQLEIPGGTPPTSATVTPAASVWQAIAQSGVFSDGFQTTGIAADQRERRVPRPHGHGKVERGDDADRAERMPLLDQPMAGALAGDRQAVELPAQARRRNRRCRSSPALRRGLPARSCRPRA